MHHEQPVLTFAVDIQVSSIVPEHRLHQLRYPRCCQQSKAMSVGKTTQVTLLLLTHICFIQGSHFAAQAGPEIQSSCLTFLRTEIIVMCHHVHLWQIRLMWENKCLLRSSGFSVQLTAVLGFWP